MWSSLGYTFLSQACEASYTLLRKCLSSSPVKMVCSTAKKKLDTEEDSSHLQLQEPLVRTVTISVIIPPHFSTTGVFSKLTQYLNMFSNIFHISWSKNDTEKVIIFLCYQKKNNKKKKKRK